MTPERKVEFLKKILEGSALSAFRSLLEGYVEGGLLKPEMTVAEALTTVHKKLTDLAQEVVILQAPPDLEDSVRGFFKIQKALGESCEPGESNADDKKTDDS